MAQKPIFPKEFIKSSIENYTFKINSNSKIIYQLILISFVLLCSALPFIYLDVIINASGLITTDEDRQMIYAPVSGQVLNSKLKENLDVIAGDTLFLLDYGLIDKKVNKTRKFILQLESFKDDLELMTNQLPDHKPTLKTLQYQSELLEFQSHYEKLISVWHSAEKNYKRQKQLFDEKVISEMDFERDELKYNQTKNEAALFVKQKKKQWQQTIVNYKEEIDEQSVVISQLKEEKNKYLVTSPIDGTLQNIYPVEKGQYVQAGIKLVELSPDTKLIASCWIPPSKIGLLRAG